jgi:tetratricopeptide (TPR) repeat protein
VTIQSSINELGLFDLFQVLYHSQKSGRLIITDTVQERGAHILFREGAVCFASIYDKSPKSIGIILEEWGVLDEISAARIEEKSGKYKSLVDCLVGEGISSQNHLENFFAARVREVVYSVFKWENGDCRFIEEDLDEKREVLVLLNTENLILEGARRIVEWSNINNKVPSRHSVFKFCKETEGQQLNLKPQEWEILSLIDGNRSVYEINEEVGGDLFSTSKLIYGLVVMGVIELVESEEQKEANANLEDRIEKHLKEGRLCYDRLNLEGAAAEFEKIVQIDPENFEALRMLGEIYYKLDRLSEALRFLEKARAKRPNNQKAMFIKGYLHARLGEVDKAIREWEELKEKTESKKIVKLVENRIAVAREWSKVMAEY